MRITDETNFLSQILYPEFPQKYRYDTTNKKWVKRINRSDAIGRICSVSPNQGEVFYLRMLLHHVRGATCFEDLLTVHEVAVSSFQEACRLRGLLQEDQEWDIVLREAIETRRPPAIRQLFATLIVFCSPPNPSALLEGQIHAMGDDLERMYPTAQPRQIRTMILIDIERRVQRAGFANLSDAHLPAVSQEERREVAELIQQIEVESLPLVIRDEIVENRDEQRRVFTERHANLLPSQRTLVDRVIQAVRNQEALAVFVDAPGGTGKTYCFNTILSGVRCEGNIALAVAFSGIAATLLEKGRTFHSRFKAPIVPTATSTCDIVVQREIAALVRQCKVIVFDEAPMAHRFLLEALDRSLRDVMNLDLPFGGKVIVLGGDFRQVLPVVPRGSRSAIVNASIKRSPLWQIFETFPLRENMRARLAGGDSRDIQSHADWLLQIGDGSLPMDDSENINIPPDYVIDSDVPTIINWVFANLESNYTDLEWMGSRAILAPKNSAVDHLNEEITRRFPGETITLFSADQVREEDVEGRLNIPIEYLNALNASGLPPHKLTVKIGMPLILLRNISPTEGLCNGTRLIFRRLISDRLLEAKIACGTHAGKQAFIPRLNLFPSDDAFSFKWERRQFPIKPGFAMTINKSQGQTLRRAAVYLEEPVFSHGQLYVAASRVGSVENLRFALPRS